MVAVVDDADTAVDGAADGRHAGVTAAAAMMLGDIGVGVMHQSVADIVDMLVVVLAIVAAARAVISDTHAFVGP